VFKAELYRRAGVAEYWAVGPIDRTIHIFTLSADGSTYQIKILEAKDSLALASFTGCTVDFNAIFQEEHTGETENVHKTVLE
jgi:Uma2 family endonuclease